ncbi:serine hydrolase [Rhodococcus sp. 3Y1]
MHRDTLWQRVIRELRRDARLADHPLDGAAGCITASIGDLLTFAELGLLEGQSVDGVRIVSEKSAAAMRTPEIDISELFPDKSGWGLGWFHETWSGEEIFGHDGSTIGQHAYLRIFPATMSRSHC